MRDRVRDEHDVQGDHGHPELLHPHVVHGLPLRAHLLGHPEEGKGHRSPGGVHVQPKSEGTYAHSEYF